MEVYKWYLHDLGHLLKDYAREWVKERERAPRGSLEREHASGVIWGYHLVISLMQSQADVFEIPVVDLQLHDIDPERELTFDSARDDSVRLRATSQPVMSDDELREIEARCTRASAGPWTSMIEGRDHDSGSHFIRTGPDGAGEDIELSGATLDDQEFIAHARQDVPRLIEEVARLRRLLGTLAKRP